MKDHFYPFKGSLPSNHSQLLKQLHLDRFTIGFNSYDTKSLRQIVAPWKKMHPKKKAWKASMDVSENSGTPKSSILIGFSIINHPFWGTPLFWKHPYPRNLQQDLA